MKTSFFIFSIILWSCGSIKNNNSLAADGSEKSSASNNNSQLSPCVEKMIAGFKAEEKQQPPRQIYRYTYKGKTVYYVTPPCCDFFSDLYDSSCVLIGHPDGGLTGKGDGKAIDFNELKTNEKLIWKDERK